MAQLKDSIITGSLRVTDTIFSTNLNLSSLTASQAILTDANKNLVSRAITNNTSATAVSATTNLITENTLYYHKGNSNIVTVGTVTSGTWSATAINPNKGGTGVTSYAKGDILYAGAAIATTATTALSKLAIGTAGYFLKATANGPAWANTTDITALGTVTTGTWSATTINPNKGGTGVNSYAKGDILYAGAAIANTATTALSKLAIGTAGYFLKATADGPAWANTTDITALGTITTGTWNATTIAIANGGTGATSAQNAIWNLLHVADPGDLNTAKRMGSFKISSTTTNGPVSPMWGVTLNLTDDLAAGNDGTSGTTYQLAFQANTSNMWLRSITNAGSWVAWSQFITNNTTQTISGEKTFTGNLKIGTNGAGGYLNGSATNAGVNSILVGDDAWIGDCNTSGVVGIRSNYSAGTQAGLAFYKYDGTYWGKLVADDTYLLTDKQIRLTAAAMTTMAIQVVNESGARVQLGISSNDKLGVYTNGYLTTSNSVQTFTESNLWLIYRENDGKVHSPTYIDAIIKVYEKTYSSLAANSSVNYTANEMSPAVSTPAGYKPAAILSFTTGSSNACMCAIYGQSTGTSGFVTIRNISGSAITNKTIAVKMLYLKIDT